MPRRIHIAIWGPAVLAATAALVQPGNHVASALHAGGATGAGAKANQTDDVIVRTRVELIRTVASASPGTRILIAPGEYRGGLNFSDLAGTQADPIVITALDVKNPPVILGGNTCLHLRRPRHIQLRHLTLAAATGNGLNIDDGGDPERPAVHVDLANLKVHDIGPKGNRDGIKLSGVNDFSIAQCTIERWGEGGSAIDMVGCHDGEISHCQFVFRGDLAANGVQAKGGSSKITIRRCRFDNAGGRGVNIGGSTGEAYFRPRSPGYEAKDLTVQDCTFIGSMAPIAYVGVDGATVRYNTIYRPSRWVVRILQESKGEGFAPCRNGSFSNNLIVFRSDELRAAVNIGSGTSPETFRFASNHWHCIDDPARSGQIDLPVKESNGRYGQDPKFVDVESSDFRLQDDSPVRDAGVREE